MTYTTREQRTLGLFKRRGLLEYRDLSAYYCSACELVFGVVCPNCGAEAPKSHMQDRLQIFVPIKRPVHITFNSGHHWTQVICKKCDYTFKVIVSNGSFG